MYIAYITIIASIFIICICICFCNYQNNISNYDVSDYIKLQNVKTIAETIINNIEDNYQNSIVTDIDDIKKDIEYILSIIDTNDNK